MRDMRLYRNKSVSASPHEFVGAGYHVALNDMYGFPFMDYRGMNLL